MDKTLGSNKKIFWGIGALLFLLLVFAVLLFSISFGGTPTKTSFPRIAGMNIGAVLTVDNVSRPDRLAAEFLAAEPLSR